MPTEALCTACHRRDRTEGSVRCAKCREIQREAGRRFRTKARVERAHFCSSCRHHPPTEGRKQCERCIGYADGRLARFKAQGRCACGREPPEGRKTCDECLKRIRDARAARVAAGKCDTCCVADRDRPRSPYCAECRKKHTARLRAANYGVSAAEYDQRVASQEGRCAICGTTPSGDSKDGVLYVDHDHVTGSVRGLLCNGCNAALGWMRDNPDALRAAAEYIERWKTLRAV